MPRYRITLVARINQVRAIGKQFIVFGRTLAPGQIGGDLPLGRRLPQRAQRVTARREAARGRSEACQQGIAVRRHLNRFEARAKAQPPPGRGQFLMRKNGLLPGAAVGSKGLGAVGREARTLDLQPPHTVERTQAGVPRLKTQISALVAECGARHASFEFGVCVNAPAELDLEAFQGATQPTNLALKGGPVGLHADRHLVFRHRAVEGAVATERSAEVTLVKEDRSPQAGTLAPGSRVADATILRC